MSCSGSKIAIATLDRAKGASFIYVFKSTAVAFSVNSFRNAQQSVDVKLNDSRDGLHTTDAW